MSICNIQKPTQIVTLCNERGGLKAFTENLSSTTGRLSVCLQEESEERQALSKKAQSMMEEKDDEIKKLNEAILNAKCHAIRDLQLAERDAIKQSLAEEEKRLDEMMEVERRNALQMYEERERERQLQRLKLAPTHFCYECTFS